MTPPLGGKRRERKRLKRCAHAGMIRFRDDRADTVTYECSRCGAKVVNSVQALRDHAGDPLPDRIARRMEDA